MRREVLNNLTQPRQFRFGWLTFPIYVYCYSLPRIFRHGKLCRIIC